MHYLFWWIWVFSLEVFGWLKLHMLHSIYWTIGHNRTVVIHVRLTMLTNNKLYMDQIGAWSTMSWYLGAFCIMVERISFGNRMKVKSVDTGTYWSSWSNLLCFIPYKLLFVGTMHNHTSFMDTCIMAEPILPYTRLSIEDMKILTLNVSKLTVSWLL